MVQNHYPWVAERKTFEGWSCRARPVQPVEYQFITIMHMHNYVCSSSCSGGYLCLQHQFRRFWGSLWYFLSACRLSACCSKGQTLGRGGVEVAVSKSTAGACHAQRLWIPADLLTKVPMEVLPSPAHSLRSS